MKTKKQVLIENKEISTLINAVINRIGMNSVNDVNRHGIDGGFSGFIYYSDTHNFAIRHRKAIVSLLENEYQELGYSNVLDMVSNFGVFRGSGLDQDDQKDLYKYLAGVKTNQGAITNVMAWYAAEYVCRLFDE